MPETNLHSSPELYNTTLLIVNILKNVQLKYLNYLLHNLIFLYSAYYPTHLDFHNTATRTSYQIVLRPITYCILLAIAFLTSAQYIKPS